MFIWDFFQKQYKHHYNLGFGLDLRVLLFGIEFMILLTRNNDVNSY